MFGRIRKRWKLERAAIEGDPRGATIPKWAGHLAIGGFREQGWNAYDQKQGGKVVATGKWGDEILLLRGGSISCTQYEKPPPPPAEQGDKAEIVAEAEAWLRQCSAWLLSTNLDMECPMETDPLDIADNLAALRARASQ